MWGCPDYVAQVNLVMPSDTFLWNDGNVEMLKRFASKQQNKHTILEPKWQHFSVETSTNGQWLIYQSTSERQLQ